MAGLDAGLSDVLPGSAGSFCSLPSRHVFLIPACVPYVLGGAWHS